MLRTDAWRSLSGTAVRVFLELHTRFYGGNNGKLSLSLDEASRLLDLGKATVARALRELVEKGFLELKRRGQWYGRKASEYALTLKDCDGKPATFAYKQYVKNPKRPRMPRSHSRTAKTFLGSEMGPSDGPTVSK